MDFHLQIDGFSFVPVIFEKYWMTNKYYEHFIEYISIFSAKLHYNLYCTCCNIQSACYTSNLNSSLKIVQQFIFYTSTDRTIYFSYRTDPIQSQVLKGNT